MQKITEIIKIEDKEKLLFYLDYTEQLIDFYEKNKFDTSELVNEYQMLQQRLSELKD